VNRSGRRLLRRPVLSPLSLSLYEAITNSSLLSHFFSDQYFFSTTLHLFNSFPTLCETLGVMPLPDPAFLEIIRGCITRSLVPLAWFLHSASWSPCLESVLSSWHPLGITQACPNFLLLVKECSAEVVFEEIKNSLFWVVGVKERY